VGRVAAIAAGVLALVGGALPGLAQTGSARAAGQDVTGTWVTEGGRSRVRLGPCGRALCGTIVWTEIDALDARNPDPALRGRTIKGVQMLSKGRPEGEGWTGELYNPLDGRTYSGRLRLTGPRTLELSGCVLAGLICKSQIWSRAP
jgi:uncharacterized protein (DUF2147 family)